ncbi:MAG: hypothetical protein K9N47_22565 [Prosthecobacter sp.]|uniref:hypothetical protein n=1 Tax=Prosthecobacter sp. TaxID=1965333 RepID=UPI00260B0B4E|nr:hypothetical protein [Prosthecobacter sp.]MCF7788926.1 hypothetical protein [Prosthecobacter sp.]
MKRTLCLIAGLLTLSLLPSSAADEKAYPAKNPVLTYEVPAKWVTEVDPSDDSVSITSDDDRISVNFAEVDVDASMEVFKELVPEMVKELKDAKVVQPAKEQTVDGLTSYISGYIGTTDGSEAMMIMILFKGGKERAILGNIVMMDPGTMPKEQAAKFDALMNSLQGAAK